MRARIYKPARNVMQSGYARTHEWVLEFDQSSAREIDPLMGWTSTNDTQTQVQLRFETREEAEAYATEAGIEYDITTPKERMPIVRPGGYGENYASARRGSTWTH